MLLACVMNVPPDPKGACGRLADQHAGVSDCSGKLTRSRGCSARCGSHITCRHTEVTPFFETEFTFLSLHYSPIRIQTRFDVFLLFKCVFDPSVCVFAARTSSPCSLIARSGETLCSVAPTSNLWGCLHLVVPSVLNDPITSGQL